MAKFTITDNQVKELQEFYAYGQFLWGNLEDLQMDLLDSVGYDVLDIEPEKMLEYVKVLTILTRHLKKMDPELKEGGES